LTAINARVAAACHVWNAAIRETIVILPNDTTVAVVDGRGLRLFRNRAAEPHIDLDVLDVPDIRGAHRGSGVRHRSVPANPDASRLDEDDFAAAVAEWISARVLDGTIARLLIVADPRTLGEMRRNLHPAATAALVGELAKDLSNHTREAIEAALIRA